MTVKELIALLEKIENKDKEVQIAIRQYNKAYPVAYCAPNDRDYLNQTECAARITVSLPDNMRTMTYKNHR